MRAAPSSEPDGVDGVDASDGVFREPGPDGANAVNASDGVFAAPTQAADVRTIQTLISPEP